MNGQNILEILPETIHSRFFEMGVNKISKIFRSTFVDMKIMFYNKNFGKFLNVKEIYVSVNNLILFC